MKIEELVVQNFRGIRYIEARGLGDTIIISGQNGSGKSCLFDAIRLLKSTYGGYQQNEWQQFFGEFQIQLHGGVQNLDRLFNRKGEPLQISAKFKLREAEKVYLNQHVRELLEDTIWQNILPEAYQYGGFKKGLFANQFRERQPEVNEKVEAELETVRRQIAEASLSAEIKIDPFGKVYTLPNRLLEIVFSCYIPQEIGVIDFHGAQRHYSREIVQGINLNLENEQQTRSQHSLYNYNNKYNNVKSEMAGSFIKELLSEKANPTEANKRSSLTDTLKELFESFFPDKEFLGPQPTKEGLLSFPVQTRTGAIHDLDELSSGEKEILYGYLRIRSSAPKNSIILLDEPELHLNPRLIRGLPEFYRKHLGEALQNQLWLVTHSDALIREAVGKPGFNVFHMIPCTVHDAGAGQLKQLTVTKQLDSALADLVGDLAAYRPGGKGLIFEGGGDSEFDKLFVQALFSEELAGINLISGANKIRVKALHEILERAYSSGDLPTKFYAITDRDTDEALEEGKAVSRFKWDVYHIENYLLDGATILSVLNSIDLRGLKTAEDVNAGLETAARQVLPSLVEHKLRVHTNSLMVGQLDLGFDPRSKSPATELAGAVLRSVNRMSEVASQQLTETHLKDKEKEYQIELSAAFADGSWIKVIPGRDILKKFCANQGIPAPYETFRNLIVARMADTGLKPLGMKRVIEQIQTD